jgi:hypothetical protein
MKSYQPAPRPAPQREQNSFYPPRTSSPSMESHQLDSFYPPRAGSPTLGSRELSLYCPSRQSSPSTCSTQSNYANPSSSSTAVRPPSIAPSCTLTTSKSKIEQGISKALPMQHASIQVPGRLKGFNADANMWSSIAAAESFVIKKRNLSSYPRLTACCCCGSVPWSYTVYVDQGNKGGTWRLLRADEVEKGACWCFTFNSSCCRSFSCCACTDRLLEIRKYIPLPGDTGYTDFSHLPEDIRAKMESFLERTPARRGSASSSCSTDSGDSVDVTSTHHVFSNASKSRPTDVNREIAAHSFYLSKPVLFTVTKNSDCLHSALTGLSWALCCTYNCSCLNCFPCFNFLPCGSIQVHAAESNAGGITNTALVGDITSPWSSALSCCCISTCTCCSLPHADLRDEMVDLNSSVSRVARVASVCFYGGWNKQTGHTYHFPVSFPDSKLMKADFGVITKTRRSLFCVEVESLCRLRFDEKHQSKITAQHKVAALGTQLALL